MRIKHFKMPLKEGGMSRTTEGAGGWIGKEGEKWSERGRGGRGGGTSKKAKHCLVIPVSRFEFANSLTL